MAKRVGLFLVEQYPIREAVAYVQHAEARGFDSVWQGEVTTGSDAVVPMAVYAAQTSKMLIGSAVANIWDRHAARIAATFATLDQVARDRIVCGLGVWWEPVAQQLGITRQKPLLAMREMILGLRSLFNGSTTTLKGEHVYLDGVQFVGGRLNIPIYIGATGRKLLALGGELADGVILNYLVSAQYTEEAVEAMAVGAALAGKPFDAIERPQLIICSVNQDARKAINLAKSMVTRYLVEQSNIMRASGVRQELLDDLQQAARITTDIDKQERWQALERLVPDDVVQSLTASGTPDDVRNSVRKYIEHGASFPIICPIGDDVRLVIDTFANGY